MEVDTFWNHDNTVTVKLNGEDLDIICAGLGVAEDAGKLCWKGHDLAQVLGSLCIILDHQDEKS